MVYRPVVRFLALLCLLLISRLLPGQRITSAYEPIADSLHVGAGNYLPHFDRGYTVMLPDSGTATGLLLAIEDRPPDLETADPGSLIHPAALAAGLGVLYLSTGVPVDLFLDTTSLEYVHRTLREVAQAHGLEARPVFLFGSMVAGHRALKYVEFVRRGDKPWRPDLRGAILSESPLDWVRMWFEGVKQFRDALTPVKTFEGQLIRTLFADAWGVTPVEDPERFAEFSPYSYFTEEVDNRLLFNDLFIRAYTYAPLNHWSTMNGNNVYDCNFPDMVGLINEQHLIGNRRAELVVYTPGETKSSHEMQKQADTWLRVDKQELVDWVIACLFDH